jgi:hypothetical protein
MQMVDELGAADGMRSLLRECTSASKKIMLAAVS